MNGDEKETKTADENQEKSTSESTSAGPKGVPGLEDAPDQQETQPLEQFHQALLEDQQVGVVRGIPEDYRNFEFSFQDKSYRRKFHNYLLAEQIEGNVRGIPRDLDDFTHRFAGELIPPEPESDPNAGMIDSAAKNSTIDMSLLDAPGLSNDMIEAMQTQEQIGTSMIDSIGSAGKKIRQHLNKVDEHKRSLVATDFYGLTFNNDDEVDYIGELKKTSDALKGQLFQAYSTLKNERDRLERKKAELEVTEARTGRGTGLGMAVPQVEYKRVPEENKAAYNEIEQRINRIDEKIDEVQPSGTERLRHSANTFLSALTGEIPAGFFEGIATLSTATNKMMKVVGEKAPMAGGGIEAVRRLLEGEPGKYDEVKELATWQIGQKIRQVAADQFPTDPTMQDEFIETMLPAATGSFGAFAAGGFGARALGMSASAFAGTAAATGGMGQAYAQAKAYGASEEDAQLAGQWGFVPGVIQVFPVMRLLDRYDRAAGGQLKNTLKQIFKEGRAGSLEEALVEASGQAGFEMIADQIYREEPELLKSMDKIGQAAGAGAFAGFIANIITGGAARGMARRQPRPPLSEQADATGQGPADGQGGDGSAPTPVDLDGPGITWDTDAPADAQVEQIMDQVETMESVRDMMADQGQDTSEYDKIIQSGYQEVSRITSELEQDELEAVKARQRPESAPSIAGLLTDGSESVTESQRQQLEQTRQAQQNLATQGTIGDAVGSRVNYAGYTGRLQQDNEGNFVVQTDDGVMVEVVDTQKDPGVSLEEAGVERNFASMRQFTYNPAEENFVMEVTDPSSGEIETGTFEYVRTNTDDAGVPVSVTMTNEAGQERTFRAPEAVEDVIWGQFFSEGTDMQALDREMRRALDAEQGAVAEATDAEPLQDIDLPPTEVSLDDGDSRLDPVFNAFDNDGTLTEEQQTAALDWANEKLNQIAEANPPNASELVSTLEQFELEVLTYGEQQTTSDMGDESTDGNQAAVSESAPTEAQQATEQPAESGPQPGAATGTTTEQSAEPGADGDGSGIVEIDYSQTDDQGREYTYRTNTTTDNQGFTTVDYEFQRQGQTTDNWNRAAVPISETDVANKVPSEDSLPDDINIDEYTVKVHQVRIAPDGTTDAQVTLQHNSDSDQTIRNIDVELVDGAAAIRQQQEELQAQAETTTEQSDTDRQATPADATFTTNKTYQEFLDDKAYAISGFEDMDTSRKRELYTEWVAEQARGGRELDPVAIQSLDPTLVIISPELRTALFGEMDDAAAKMLRKAVEQYPMISIGDVARVAKKITGIDNSDVIKSNHISEAISYEVDRIDNNIMDVDGIAQQIRLGDTHPGSYDRMSEVEAALPVDDAMWEAHDELIQTLRGGRDKPKKTMDFATYERFKKLVSLGYETAIRNAYATATESNADYMNHDNAASELDYRTTRRLNAMVLRDVKRLIDRVDNSNPETGNLLEAGTYTQLVVNELNDYNQLNDPSQEKKTYDTGQYFALPIPQPDNVVKVLLDAPVPAEAQPLTEDIDGRIPKKSDKIPGDVDRFNYVAPETDKTPTVRRWQKDDPLSFAVSSDELRPAMMGIYYDGEAGGKVATDGHVLVFNPDGRVKSNKVVDPRTGNEISEDFPNWRAVVPDRNNLAFEVPITDEIVNRVYRNDRAQKFIDGREIQNVFTGPTANRIVFNNSVLTKAFMSLKGLGAENITLKYNAPNRAGLLIDRDNPDRFALVMPVLMDGYSATPSDTSILYGFYSVLSQNASATPASVEQAIQENAQAFEAEQQRLEQATTDALKSEDAFGLRDARKKLTEQKRQYKNAQMQNDAALAVMEGKDLPLPYLLNESFNRSQNINTGRSEIKGSTSDGYHVIADQAEDGSYNVMISEGDDGPTFFNKRIPDGELTRVVNEQIKRRRNEPDPEVANELSQRATELRGQLDSLLSEFNDMISGQLSAGIDPRLVAQSARIIAKGAQLGFVKFQQFANYIAENYGSDFWNEIFDSFKAAYVARMRKQNNPQGEDLDAIQNSTAEQWLAADESGAGEASDTTTQPDEASQVEDTGAEETINSPDALFPPDAGDKGLNVPDAPAGLFTAGRDYTPAQKAAIERGKFGAKEDPPTVMERIKQTKYLASLKLRQGVMDQFNSLKQILGDQKAWMMAQLSQATTGALEATIDFGRPFLQDGAINVDIDQKSFKQILEPLGKELDDWFRWMAGNRSYQIKQEDARRLAEWEESGKEGPKPQSREALLSDDDIAALRELNEGEMEDGRSRAEVYDQVRREYEELNQAVVNIAVETGLVNAEQAQDWAEQGFYVPFYRMVDSETRGPKVFKDDLAKQTAFKKLKGSDLPLDDLLGNTVMNWNHLFAAAMRNQAAAKALDTAVDMGIAEEVVEAAASKDAIWVRRDGDKVFYEFEDSPQALLVMDSLLSLNYDGLNNFVMKAARKFKRALTIGVTVNPEFRIANLIRDTIHSAAVVPVSANIVKNVAEGFRMTKRGSESQAAMIAGGGAFGDSGYIHGTDPELIRRTINKGLGRDTILDSRMRIQKMWDAYQDFGARMENVNRAAAFAEALKNGGTLLDANFQSRDLLDFSRTGSFPAVRAITQVVPFLNARMQGMDKMFRAMEDPNQRKQFAAVVGTYSLAAVGLYLMMKDDEDFQEAEEWERDAYHLFKIPGSDIMYRIPKPFEVGLIGTMAERFAEQLVNDAVHGELFAERLAHGLTETLSFNPVPQAAMPIIELVANKSFFTDRPIENMGMQRLSPELRKRAWTSQTAIGASQAMDKILWDDVVLSPVQIEHLVNGYFGWLGSTTLGATDMLISRPLAQSPTRPTRRISDYPVIGRFAREGDAQNSKYITNYYDNLNEITRAWADIREYRELGQLEKAKNVAEEARDILRFRTGYNRVQRMLSDINKRMEQVYNDPDMSAQEKRDQIDAMNAQKKQLAQQAVLATEPPTPAQ